MKSSLSVLILMMITLSAGFMSCTKTNFPAPYSNGDYSVFAWNDLGMHSINPSYDKLVLQPPNNNVMAQVVKRGSPPELVTEGITVSYRIIDNTTSYNKRLFGGFWDFSNKLFGVTLAHNIGLKGNGLSGNMTAAGDHFIVEGIPVVPVNDADVYNPYQVAEIVVKDGNGNILTQTRATVPVSDEISCSKCHGSDAFTAILTSHDDAFGTNFSATGNQPVLCASCHPSPAIGINTGSEMYLSRAIHGSHATKTGITCSDCHPGTTAKYNRSIKHTTDDGNCTTCHGDMANVASTIEAGRIPWVTEPLCVTCHTGVTGVNTGTTLFRNSQGHGDMYCSACHGSPHAMYPSSEASDNFQSEQYQGFSTIIKTIGSCGVCHNSSRGESKLSEFEEVHGRTNPEEVTGCSACHTSISATIARWPHAYTWKDSN